MKYIIKLLGEALTWKWSLIFILMFVFGLRQRSQLIQSSIALQERLNHWDILIGITGDPYMLLYLVLPCMLFLSCLSIWRSWNPLYLIRVSSWGKWIAYSVKEFSYFVLVSVIALLITSFVLTIKIPYQAGWSLYSSTDTTTFNYISSISQTSNLPPYIVLILQIGLLVVMFLSLHAFIAATFIYLPNMLYLWFISFIILFYALVSFGYFPGSPLIVPFNYMTFHSSYGVYGSVYPAFMILLGILIISVYMIPLVKKVKGVKHAE